MVVVVQLSRKSTNEAKPQLDETSTDPKLYIRDTTFKKKDIQCILVDVIG